MENIAMPTRTLGVSQRQIGKWITGIICGMNAFKRKTEEVEFEHI